MPIAATCGCGRILTEDDDWVGHTADCPSCGAPIRLPRPQGPISSLPSYCCLILGIIALSIGLSTIAGVPNRMLPPTISRVVEESRADQAQTVAVFIALSGLVMAWVGRRAKSWRRGLGLVCSWAALAISIMHPIAVAGGSRNAARRSQCVNNLKQIGLALHNYKSFEGAFPARAICDPRGRPLLSWRVAILPYLEQKALYDKFHLDEPWDSPHNLRLADQIPHCYVCPSQAEWSDKLTLYQVLDGPGAFLDEVRPTRDSEITDGPAETIAVVEAPTPAPWTNPRDCPFAPDRPFRPWAVTHRGGINALMCDGSVRFVKETTPEAEFKAAATRNGGDGLGPGMK